MTFDRFDIFAAHRLFWELHEEGSFYRERGRTLRRIMQADKRLASPLGISDGFEPDADTLSSNAYAIYHELCSDHGVVPGVPETHRGMTYAGWLPAR